jgi:hypothetical protein
MFGINLNTIESVAGLAATAMLGPEAGIAMNVAFGAMSSQFANQSFQSGLTQAGFSGDMSSVMNSFDSGFASGFGMAASAFTGGGSSAFLSQAMDAAYSAGLAQGQQNVAQAIAKLLTEANPQNAANGGTSANGATADAGATSQGDLASQIENTGLALNNQQDGTDSSDGPASTSKGAAAGQNWIEAIAAAFGKALGDLSAKVVGEANDLSTLAGQAGGSGSDQQAQAEAFQAKLTQFTADSQTLGMLSNAFSTGLKDIGQGLSTMAGRQ